MQYLHTNNASSNLRDAITPGSSTVRVTSGQGTLFPNPGLDQSFFITVEDRRTGRIEIMLCTLRTGDTMTVTRGQQGTIPQSFAIGVNVSNRITAQILNEFVVATIDMIPTARIPPITSAMIATEGLDASVTKTGVFAAARIPAITTGMITSLDAAKLTGSIDPARIVSVPAVALPAIPAANLTSVPAASLTGTVSPNRIAATSLDNSKISDLAASKLTGTIHQDRMPSSFVATGSVSIGALLVSTNLTVGGPLQANTSITCPGNINGQLQHKTDGGYFYVGSYNNALYGDGYGRIWFNRNLESFNFVGEAAGVATINANHAGSGAGLTGIPFGAVIGDHADVGTIAMLRYEGGSNIHPGTDVSAGTSGSGLKYASAAGQVSGIFPPNGSIWKAIGLAVGTGTITEKTTLWRRVS